MEIKDIVMKLVGPIEPLGCSGRDSDRLENIKALTALIGELLEEVEYVARDEISHEASVKAIGTHASKFLRSLSEDYGP